MAIGKIYSTIIEVRNTDLIFRLGDINNLTEDQVMVDDWLSHKYGNEIQLDDRTFYLDSFKYVYIEESFKNVKLSTGKNLFSFMNNLEQIIGIKNLDTSQMTSMASMFEGCRSLKSIDLSNFNISNVKQCEFDSMFCGCESLTELDLSNFHNGWVDDHMFRDCSSLSVIKVPKDFTRELSKKSLYFCGIAGKSSDDYIYGSEEDFTIV